MTYRDLTKLLTECNQEIPECLEQYKPKGSPELLFQDDDDDDDDDDEEKEEEAKVSKRRRDSGNGTGNGSGLSVAVGAGWDSGDHSAVFQGEKLRRIPLLQGSPNYVIPFCFCFPLSVDTSRSVRFLFSINTFSFLSSPFLFSWFWRLCLFPVFSVSCCR